ncbi:MarR family transcriptional regulator [Martelella mediterranea]|uniref:MarR family winged helix-turn-helix transcriptional regulator n=1 Tax=Martelella mediterranea TaxID=293089 RepID=UPI001E2A0352|nr:MarR family transcriptional regulator [Martelella mediterranea]MCD1636465.1 MarR family transcriptional regulator [Martelella mediterranea]
MTDDTDLKNVPVRRLPVARFNKQVNLTLSRLLKAADSDLSREQEVILRQLRVSDGINQVALSTLVDQDSNNISRTLGLLERRGLIRRVTSPKDRRSQIVKITESGIAAHAKAYGAITQYWTAAFDGFSDEEIEAFRDLMWRMTSNLERFQRRHAEDQAKDRNGSPTPPGSP